jgi:pyruvate kinase
MEPKILVTLGPSSLKKSIVQQMSTEGVYVFRINLSHTEIDEVENTVRKIQSFTDIPVCLDSEGAQIRNGAMENGGVSYRAQETVKIHYDEILGDAENISLSPDYVGRQLDVGDEISVDFNSVLFKVIEKHKNYCLAKVEMGGLVGSNKAANVNKPIKLETITPKDKQAIEIGRQMNVSHFALSFANSGDDVKKMRNLTGKDSTLISKVESYNGLLNLKGIIEASDAILIDRGDLSREVKLVKIPFLQRRIISMVKSKGSQVFVATNLLESMISNKRPTRAEINDVVSTLLMGADGLVLAAETAIGLYPLQSVRKIRKLIEEFKKWTPNTSINELLDI